MKNKLVLVFVILQIILLVNLTPSHSYFLGESFSIKKNNIVSALSWNCCSETIDGAICQDISSEDDISCAVDTVPTKCSEFSECKLGCCVDDDEGLCTTQATKYKCENDGGIWEDEVNCLISECQKGCCVLGGDIEFTTEKRCEKLSLINGFGKDFRDVGELECLRIRETQPEGACVLDGGSCKLVTEVECLSRDGEFYENKLCSNPNVNSNCEKQKSVGCVNGKDEIYWFDSCGNRENIYSSDKSFSWNNGEILSKSESCNPNNPNINSRSCGNCNYFLGSKCSATGILDKKIRDGNFVCKNMKCVENGVERENGESWCVYDGYIGDGKDTVGSRHWKRMCIDGEIKIDSCADYRGEICVQSEIKSNKTGKNITLANCVVNEGLSCLQYNSNQGVDSKCTENPDCMIKNINLGEHFYFDMCVPKYPPGFDLTGSERAVMSGQLCSIANQECVVIEEKNWKGDWECKINCGCREKSFTKQLNDLCISLGDCGSYVNYIGEGSENIGVDNAPLVFAKDYSSYATPVQGQFAEPKDLRTTLGIIGGESEDYIESPGDFEKQLKKFEQVVGISGIAMQFLPESWLTTVSGAEVGVMAKSPTLLGSFSGAAIGAGIGMFAASYLASISGVKGEGASVMSMAGGVAGSMIGLKIFSSSLYNPYVLYGALAVMVYAMIVGWGDTREIRVKFTCLPWQPVIGGENCAKCNEDSLKPCSEYRCSSLGTACKLLNEESENPVCETLPNDGKAPVISPGEVSEGYLFNNLNNKNVELKKEGGECIPEFTGINFTLKTDEYAQCKVDFQRTEKYNEMSSYPLEQNLFSLNHSFILSMPSLGSLEVYDLSGDIREMFGNMNMYVRCRDYHGNLNQEEYTVKFCINSGPDITPVTILDYNPLNGSSIAYSIDSSNLIIKLNEPGNCKYDFADKNYSSMNNEMTCVTDVFDASFGKWTCETNLTGLISKTNNIYIRCRDQPWLGVNNNSRNLNAESFVYTLYASESELKIDFIEPQGEIEEGFEPISVKLNVRTSGGAERGVSKCAYSFTGYDKMHDFSETDSNKHSQVFDMMMRGNYTLYIKCEDIASNSIKGKTSFKLNIDSEPPNVVNIFHQGDKLKIRTDEEAECSYNLERCNFNLDDGTSMTSLFSTTHSAQWVNGQTYYIKCADIWGNKPSECSQIISASGF